MPAAAFPAAAHAFGGSETESAHIGIFHEDWHKRSQPDNLGNMCVLRVRGAAMSLSVIEGPCRVPGVPAWPRAWLLAWPPTNYVDLHAVLGPRHHTDESPGDRAAWILIKALARPPVRSMLCVRGLHCAALSVDG
jgi:hypothetical protein